MFFDSMAMSCIDHGFVNGLFTVRVRYACGKEFPTMDSKRGEPEPEPVDTPKQN
jgi:hypothetical protein